ncbi:MAG: AbrB family transcriptional regulator, partial [Aldersonia sp.]|nr:AbrB family transcriptional regulator [Aldersonia sp.]
ASSAWYLGVALLAAVMVPGLSIARFVHVPAGSLLIPLVIAAVLELTGLNFGATIPHVVLPMALVVVGWQAGLAFDRNAVRSISKALPAAIALIVAICVACAGLGLLLSQMTDATLLEGYLATTPGGLSAVLAMSASAGANTTFVAGVQLIRMLLMLFLAPLLTRLFVLLGRRHADKRRHAAAESPEVVSVGH